MRCSRFFLLVALALIAGSAAPLYADGLIRDGVGAISIGRGGTNLGFADNGAIILDNPAAMMNVSGNGLTDVGLDAVICDLHYTDPDNPSVDGAFKVFPSGMFGTVKRSADTPFAYGFGVFAPAGFGADYHMDNPHTGANSFYKSIGALAKFLPGAAVQVTDRLSLGLTVGVAVSHVELEGPFYTQTGALAGMPNLFDLQSTGVTVTGGAGLQYQLNPATTIGVAYTEESRFNFDGHARVRMLTGLGPLESEFDAETQIVWPRSLGIGMKHELCDCRRLGFDFIWYDWSAAYDQLDIRLTNATNPTVAAMSPEIRDVFPMDWQDTYSFRTGYEWEPNSERVWRLGYVYHKSPVRDATLNPYLDGVLEHAVSVGTSKLTDWGWMNLAYQFTWGPERHVGDSAIVGGDFDNSTFEASAHWLSISFLSPK